MIKLRVVIVDEDTDYLNGISHYMTFYCEGQFYVTSFDKKELLEGYLMRSGSRNEILLISDELYNSEWFVLLREKFQKVFLLSAFELKEVLGENALNTKAQNDFIGLEKAVIENNANEKQEKCNEAQNHISVINKYQSIEVICNEILSTVLKEVKGAAYARRGENTTKCISFFSANGGCGKTSLAVMCGIIASQRGEKALYINLEKINSGGAYFKRKESKGLSEIIYIIKSRKQNLSSMLEGLIERDNELGFDYLSPIDNIEEIWSLRPDEIDLLLSEIRELKKYHYVFIDLSSVLDEGTKQVLVSSNRTVLLISPDYNCMTKTKTLLRQRELRKQRNERDILTDYIVVRNKYKNNYSMQFELIEGSIKELNKVEQITIPYIEEIEAYNARTNQLKELIYIDNYKIANHIGALLDAM